MSFFFSVILGGVVAMQNKASECKLIFAFQTILTIFYRGMQKNNYVKKKTKNRNPDHLLYLVIALKDESPKDVTVINMLRNSFGKQNYIFISKYIEY